ncbi:MAG TPA: LysR family transcriptional regulator, partial [Vineibacter sp.]|nr:LysR family transcriptional regulator [Vineibacter sp.]
RAAKRLNLTPSAVSHGLARLRRLLNDALFLRSSKGISPTDRALQLREPVTEILARVDTVISAAVPFDPRTTRRRFTIGAPDALWAVFLVRLMDQLSEEAPGIDIRSRQLMPRREGQPTDQAWPLVLAELDSHVLDIAIMPAGTLPPRYVQRPVFREDFVIAMRRKHAFGRNPSLENYCAMRHLLVSLIGDDRGMVDEALAKEGLSRRVVLTVPNFMMALATVAESDMIATLPRTLVQRHAKRFGLQLCEIPLRSLRRPDDIGVVSTKAAMADAGVAWLFDRVAHGLRG